ncbi:MAG: Trk system potassium transporter TrkA [Clostridia bacterium]|nr:Trk system potassium transporter TrkA [Clostridia bacterium]
MNIVIVGDGKVGDTLIQYISGEGHSVTVIDKNPALINRVVNQYDVMGIAGNGASHEIQLEAGVKDADLFIAVAETDELNMVCCMIAKSLGAAHTVARVRDPQYSREIAFLRGHLGIDLVVNPEYDAAYEIARLIRFPAALKLDAFAKGQVDMAEIYISEGHPLAGRQLFTLSSLFGVRVLVCAIRRGEDVFIPSGDFTIMVGDSVSITASHTDLSAFFGKLGLMGKPIKSTMLLGGGRISYYLALRLGKLGIGARVIEKDDRRAEELSALLPQARVIVCDCTDSEALEEEGIGEMDACIALTDSDEENVIVSMFARTQGVERIITKVDQLSFVKMLPHIGVECTVSPRLISAAIVLRYLRGLENSRKRERTGDEEGLRSEGIKSLHKLCDGRAEALEFDVDESFAQVGVPLMSPDFNLKPNTLIACIVRDGAVIYPHGASTLEVGDSVVVVTTNRQLCELGDILE